MPPVIALSISGVFALLFIALDCRDVGFRAGLWRDPVRARRNLAYLLANLVTMVALGGATKVLLPHLPALVSWRQHPVLEIVLCFLTAELINWLAHWVKHRVPYLWNFHLQHHVETHYNTTLTLHTHGLEVVFTGVCMASVLALLGFSPLAVDVFTVSYFVANMYKHCSARMSLGPLDWLLVGPAFHRVHHAKHHRGNYGSVLTVFDVLFGTALFLPQQQAFELELGTTGGEPFGFKAEMLAFVRGW